MKKIHYAKPSITSYEHSIVNDAVINGWGESCYDYIFKFQDSFKNYLGVKHALATSSCTGALHMALKSIGVTQGDEVIVPDSTWIATAAPIDYLGATAVPVDVLTTTWCIDPKAIKEAINPKTKAIICVHLYGNLCEMDEIMQIAREHNLYVIEDSAEAIGSEYRGKKAGSIGDFGVFSFHGTKTITTGEGGMVVTNDDSLFKELSILHDHGRDPEVKKMFWASKIGFKYKMSNLQAALGYAQMQRVEELVQRQIDIFHLYKKELKRIKSVQLNEEQKYCKNSYWMSTVVFDDALNIDKDELIKYLGQNNIDARVFFHPLSSLPMYQKRANTTAYKLHKNGLNLPSYFEISEDDVVFVCEKIKQYIVQRQKR